MHWCGCPICPMHQFEHLRRPRTLQPLLNCALQMRHKLSKTLPTSDDGILIGGVNCGWNLGRSRATLCATDRSCCVYILHLVRAPCSSKMSNSALYTLHWDDRYLQYPTEPVLLENSPTRSAGLALLARTYAPTSPSSLARGRSAEMGQLNTLCRPGPPHASAEFLG